MGLTLERIFAEMPQAPFKDEVWPKFLSGNARRVLGLAPGLDRAPGASGLASDQGR